MKASLVLAGVVGVLIGHARITAAQNSILASKFGSQLIPSVVSLQVFPSQGEPWIGTGFLIRHSSRGVTFDFLATAKHVLSGEGNPGWTPEKHGRRLRIYYNRNLSEADKRRGEASRFWQEHSISTFAASRNIGYPRDQNVDVGVVLLSATYETDSQRVSRAERYSSGQSPQTEVWIANTPFAYPELLAPEPNGNDLQEVYFARYPFSVNLQTWMNPIVRSGIVASPTTQGYATGNFGPHGFLIDRAPIPGDSGAPVFARDLSFLPDGRLAGAPMGLVGVVSREITIDETLMAVSRYNQSAEVRKQRLELGLVYPAKFVGEAIANLIEER